MKQMHVNGRLFWIRILCINANGPVWAGPKNPLRITDFLMHVFNWRFKDIGFHANRGFVDLLSPNIVHEKVNMTCTAIGSRYCSSGARWKVGDFIQNSWSQLIDVSLGKIMNPKLLLKALPMVFECVWMGKCWHVKVHSVVAITGTVTEITSI